MDSQSLQTDKLVPAGLPEICAPRKELLGIIDKAAAKRCVYISAPAGCGKTVSALLWIQKSGFQSIWLGLDEYDNTPAAFYRFFCTALFTVLPQNESLTALVKAPAFSDSPVEYTMEVLSRLSIDEGRYALVLDDFHFITSEEISKSLLYVIKRLPLSVTVLILSRGEPPRAFFPLKENGKMALLGASDLAFQSDEIRRHFASFGHFITVKEAKETYSLTEGWAIAVSALALSGDITADRKVKGGLLDQYIKTQIWDRFDEELRHFLMQTSIVDEFSAELIERITENAGAGQILDGLYSGSLFISRQKNVCRYHRLFLDFLREEAEKEAPSERQALFKKAAGYYAETDDHFNALRYYIKCSDSEGIAGSLYRYMKFSGQSSSDLSRIYFINDLPGHMLEQNPVLYVACAYCALLFSEAENYYFYMNKVYERLADIVGENEAFFTSVNFLFITDPRYTVTEQFARLRDVVPPKSLDDQYMPKSLCHNMPYPHRSFRDHSHYAKDTDAFFAEYKRMYLPILGSYYPFIEAGIRAGLLYEKNMLKDSLKLVANDPDTDSGELAFATRMLKAACQYGMGSEDDAARTREDIRALLKTEGLFYLLPVLSAYETKLRLEKGDRTTAKTWLENYFVIEAQKPELNRIFTYFATIRAYIVLGEFEKARKLCRMLIDLSVDFRRLLDKIEAEVLLTIVLWLTGEKGEAARLLKESLSVAKPYGFVRVYADEGKAILPILKKLLKPPGKESGRTAADRYLQEVYLAAYEQSKRSKGIACAAAVQKPVKLSGRQKYVLELLAQGYKNVEIVQFSGLSINTIRVHTRVAYQKLEVNNAADAVLRARELELIE